MKNGLKVEQILESYTFNDKMFPVGSFIIHKSKDVNQILELLNFTPEYLSENILLFLT